MQIGKKYDPDKVLFRHWCQLVPDTASAKKTLQKDLLKTAALCMEKAYMLKDSLGKSGIKSLIFAEICDVIGERSKRLQEIVF
ncbi:MAG: hypothetical protein JSS34_03595 [Proteobacteria bacterium]|nr:hypothetical protein [Pseudomonadota bacterium]